MMGIVFVGLLAVGFPAIGQSVIVKCVDVKGQVMYVSGSCEPGQRAASLKSYDAVRDDPNARRRVAEAEREVSARRATYGNQAQAVYVPPASMPSGCAAAKAHRDSVLRAAGLRRTYDLLQQLDEHVRQACR